MAIGKVIQTKGEEATVTIERQDMCGDCHNCSVLNEKKSCTIQCMNECASKEGDLVEIALENDIFLKATFIMYGFPLIALLVGLAIGSGIGTEIGAGSYQEVVIFGTGILAMTITYLIIKKKEKKRKYEALLPRIIKVIE